MGKTKIKDNEKEKEIIRTSAAASGESALPASRTIDNDPGNEDHDNYIIYTNNIYSYVDDFIEENYPGISNEELKTNKAFFPLLVQYIYNNYIGDILGNKLSLKMQGIRPVYNNIDLLDSFFNTYTSLVYKYKYNNKPSLVEFSIFTGINIDTFYNWLNGNYEDIYKSVSVNDLNKDGRKHITYNYVEAVRKWQAVCESALLDSTDTIKDIFILKAKHGYRDNNNDINITVNHKAVISADTLPDLIGLNDGKM